RPERPGGRTAPGPDPADRSALEGPRARRHAVLPPGRRRPAPGPDQAAVRRVPGAARTRQPRLPGSRPGLGEAEHRYAARSLARDGHLQRVPVPAAPRCRPRADRPWVAGHDPDVLGLLLAPTHQPDPER